MKKLIYIFTFFLLFSSCEKKTKEYKPIRKSKVNSEIFSKSKIFPAIFISDNYLDLKLDTIIEDGNYIGIYKDSTIAFVGAFKNSKPDGLFHFYYFNGKIRSTSFFENGIENGPFTYWDEDGYLTESGDEKNGELEGFHYTWWNNHTLRSKTYYRNGEIEGVDYFYYNNGKIDWFQEYKNGKSNGIYKKFYENGKLKEFGKYQEGYKVGIWKEVFSNEKIRSLKYYTNSIGQKERRKLNQYKNEMGGNHLSFPTKIWIEYDSIGNIISKTFYNNSSQIKKREEYFSNGKIQKITLFDGEVPYMCSRHPGYEIKKGKFQEFYNDGKIRTTGLYENNQKQKEWKYFNNEGEIIKTEKYKNDTLITK